MDSMSNEIATMPKSELEWTQKVCPIISTMVFIPNLSEAVYTEAYCIGRRCAMWQWRPDVVGSEAPPTATGRCGLPRSPKE